MRILAPQPNNSPRSGKFNLPSRGSHHAELVEFEDLGLQPNPYKEGKEEQKLKLVFELEDGSKQFHWISPNLHPMSKFYALTTALLGKNPPAVLEMEDLIGLSCEIDIDHYKNGKGQERSKIVDFRRLPR